MPQRMEQRGQDTSQADSGDSKFFWATPNQVPVDMRQAIVGYPLLATLVMPYSRECTLGQHSGQLVGARGNWSRLLHFLD